MTECEFCEEISSRSVSRFEQIYDGVTSSRIVARTERFVVLPTIGQLTAGSLLVLPTRHIETCAQLSPDERMEMMELIGDMMKQTERFGDPICFEHGATKVSGASCGIYHAHMHIVPLPWKVQPSRLFPEHQEVSENLEASLSMLGSAKQYLLLSDGIENLSLELEASDRTHPSQFFRKRIVDTFNLERNWDWRTYKGVEPDLLKTVDRFSLNHA